MARVEWVRLRLENWALWRTRRDSGGSGWYGCSVFMTEYTGDRYRESRIPVDDVDAELTDQAVNSLLADRSHLHRTLVLYYVRGVGIRGAALAMGRAESTIKAHLEQADQALAEWFRDRAERRRAICDRP